MPHRTFLALDLDEAIRDRIVAAGQAIPAGGVKLKWVEPENLHVTLRFLGDVEDALLPAVLDLVGGAAATVDPFEFDVRGVIAVPSSAARMRMLWVGVQDPTERALELYRKIDLALADVHVHQEERSYRPHITLARVRSIASPGPMHAAVMAMRDMDFGVQHAEEVVAYSSVMDRDGPIYTAMARLPLRR